MSDLPVIGITLGDPTGIGPEIVAKSLLRPEVYQACRPAGYWKSIGAGSHDQDLRTRSHPPPDQPRV